MDDWMAIVTQITSIGMKLLPLLLVKGAGERRASDNPTYRLGPLLFTNEKGTVWAQNIGSGEVALSYALTSDQSVLVETQPLAAGNFYNATTDLSRFELGQVSLAPTATAFSVAGMPGRALSFAIKMLAFGLAFRIIGNTTVGVFKDSNGYYLKFTNDKPILGWKLDATVSDTKGESTHVSTELKSNERAAQGEEYVAIARLPKGVDPDPIVGNLSLWITMDAETYMKATAERRQHECSLQTHGESPLQRAL